jgi:osmoprotectant transport system substrate-binding protein
VIRTRTRRLAVLVVAGLLALAGCGADAPPPLTPPGSVARDVDLTGQTYTVGSKQFDEQLVLCKMTIALLQSVRATAIDRCGAPNSDRVRSQLTGGQVDMYWEYTGTAWRTYLSQEARLADPQALYSAVKAADAGNDVSWLRMTPFNNTYAIGVRADVAQRVGARSISDLARLVQSGAPEGTLCVAQEFTGREDGLQGLLRTYGFQLPAGSLDTIDEDRIYDALARTDPCSFGEVFATDGRLNALRIATLADDRGYFLPYNAALTVRTEVLDRAPRLALVAEAVAPTLTEPVMRELNARVSVGGRDPDQVARGFLREQGLIG